MRQRRAAIRAPALLPAAVLPAAVLAAAGMAGPSPVVGVPASAEEREQAPAFRLRDPEITESSALVHSRTDPHLVLTVNDSGDSARVFAVDTRSGRTVGETRLEGVENVDFEALAFAPGGRLLVGDIGDNDAERESVQVHRIDEPGRGDATVRPDTLRLTYADGPRDAEALLVHDGRIVVVSKRAFGGEVWRGPSADSFPGNATMEKVAAAPGTVSDATVLGDGRVVLRNYTAAFVMTPQWQIAQTLMLPSTELGESAAAPPRGAWFYAGTEGTESPVYRIDVPRAQSGGATPPPSPPTSRPDSTGGESGGAESDGGGPDGEARTLLVTGAVLVLVGGVVLLLRRRT